MPAKPIIYDGRVEPLPEQTALRAGPLSLIYENGDLRYIKLGDQELIRRIYVAVRDHNWDTIAPLLSNVRLEIGDDSFQITYEVNHQLRDIDFYWQGSIHGEADGTITFKMDGEARSTFRRNRIGFCILHPADCAGVACRVTQVNGAVEETTFPQAISAHQPFFNIQSIAQRVTPTLWAEVQFSGDIFEMEDQRNWTDASYKTYCTPLEQLFPVEIKAGTKITQTVTLKLQGDLPTTFSDSAASGPTFRLNPAQTSPLPRIGLAMSTDHQSLSQTAIQRLKALNLSHLRVDLRLSDPHHVAVLKQAAEQAAALGLSLEAVLFLSDNAAQELKTLADVLNDLQPLIAHWFIFYQTGIATPAKWIELARTYLADYAPQARFGSGTHAYFTELNRNRPPVEVLDLVCYSLNPQVHAFDNASLVETLATQATTVDSTRQFVNGLPIAITPITFQPRFNPNATGPEPEPEPGELPSQVDPRQMSLFGAGWTIGSLKYIGQSGVDSVTYYETVGWRGVLADEAGSPLPEKFYAQPNTVFPLYHILADVGDFAGGEVITTQSSHPLQIEGLALTQGDRVCVLLANLSHEPKRITVIGLKDQVTIRYLDETTAEAAMANPEAFRAQTGSQQAVTDGTLEVQLRPYAIARIDI